MLDLRLNSADNKGRSDWRGKQREIKRNEKKIKKKKMKGVWKTGTVRQQYTDSRTTKSQLSEQRKTRKEI